MSSVVSYTSDLPVILNRLKRIEGQVRGLQRMTSEGSYCVDVLTQISSVSRALEKVALIVLRHHVAGCVKDSVGKLDTEDKLDELVEVVERFLRT